jgi:hypothetical protein
MYRVFCESLQRYLSDFDYEDKRYRLAESFTLLTNEDNYKEHKIKETSIYKKISQFLYFAEINTNTYPRFKAFLWTLESRNMIGNPEYNILSKKDLKEQAKILNMILKLTYWG